MGVTGHGIGLWFCTCFKDRSTLSRKLISTLSKLKTNERACKLTVGSGATQQNSSIGWPMERRGLTCFEFELPASYFPFLLLSLLKPAKFALCCLIKIIQSQAQTTIVRKFTPPPCSPSGSIQIISMDSRSELAGHLSGNLADYKFISSKPGEITIVPLHSYEARAKPELEERIIWLEENVRVLLQDKAILEQERVALKREHLYKKLCVGLHDLWWPQLTNATRTTIVQYGPGNLPSIFYSWWLQWHEVYPVQFPLPPAIRHFGPASVDSIRFIYDGATLRESEVSRAVGVAWATVSENDRQLMLLCWSGFCAARAIRNKIAHPKMTKVEAVKILGCDIAGSFQNLHTIACAMADEMFSD